MTTTETPKETAADRIAARAVHILDEALADYGPGRTYTQLDQVRAYMEDPASWEPIENDLTESRAEVSRLRGVLEGLRTRLEDERAKRIAVRKAATSPVARITETARIASLTRALADLAEMYPPAGQEGAGS